MKSYPLAPVRVPPPGFALVIVLGFLVLLTVLVLAFFTSVTTDYASTKQYSSSSTTRQLADTVVQVVMGQIKTATVGTDPTTNAALTWASQPGMIRSYDNSGQPATNYKLYSSDAMTAAGSLSLKQVNDFNTNWSLNPALWTDLNAPVTDATGTANYPIIDGNHLVTLNGSLTYDADGDGQPDIQGFSILNAPTTSRPRATRFRCRSNGSINCVTARSQPRPTRTRIPWPSPGPQPATLSWDASLSGPTMKPAS